MDQHTVEKVNFAFASDTLKTIILFVPGSIERLTRIEINDDISYTNIVSFILLLT